MAGVHIQMYGTGSGGVENAVASIDVPEDGRLVGCQWAMYGDLDADQEFLEAELSFMATNQLSTNDARGAISSVKCRANLTTSGAAVNGVNTHHPMNLPVAAGERLYLHISATAGVNSVAHAMLHFEFPGTPGRRSQRRR